MNVAEFKKAGKEMVDYICEYYETLRSRRVVADVEPGYLRPMIPKQAPENPELWEDIMSDVENKIMPGVTHWNHPQFHAYFASGNSFPSILGDMLSSALGIIGFSWASCPASAELEAIVTDWYGQAIGLPDEFIACKSNQSGGGVIEGSASECILVSLLAARTQAIKHLKSTRPNAEDSEFLPQLVAYCSQEAHSSVEKAAMIAMVKLRILETDDRFRLRGDTLLKAMQSDQTLGLMPFFVVGVLGTTGGACFDVLTEIGPVCKSFPKVWLHIDAAYAGSAFICPELRNFMQGVEYADSFNTNANKWFLVNFDCSCLWVKNRQRLTHALNVNPLYLRHNNADEAIDYRHWGIPLSRRFRSLKLWFVMRKYGISGLQAYIRNHITLAKHFESLMKMDSRFEIENEVNMSLVCFRLKASSEANYEFLANINHSGKIHMIPSLLKGKYIIRFCVTAEETTKADIEYSWGVIQSNANLVLEKFAKPLNRKLSRRFSFTRSISREMYNKSLSRTNLFDGGQSILIPDDSILDDERLIDEEEDELKKIHIIDTIDSLEKNITKQELLNGNDIYTTNNIESVRCDCVTENRR